MIDAKKIRESIENRDLKELIRSNMVNHKDISMEIALMYEKLDDINNTNLRDELKMHLEVLHLYAITINDAIFGGLLKFIDKE